MISDRPVSADMAVVICAYSNTRWPQLVRCLASLQSQSIRAEEIVVVIDHNRDLYERVCNSFTDIPVLENTDERGLSGARNTGIRNTTSSVVAFIDDDAEADVHWVRELSAPFAESSVMGVGGTIHPIWATGMPRWMPSEFFWVIGCSYRGMPESVTPIRNVIGANMAFRREVFQAVGMFRNGVGRRGDTPLGCEETELSIRARQHFAGRQIVLAPDAVVHHQVAEVRTRPGYFARRCFAEGKSKAQVTALVGSSDGLATERNYTRVTLPNGVRSGLSDGVRRGDFAGPIRSMAIVGGLALTTAGYLRGRIALRSVRDVSHRAPSLVPE